MCFRLARLQPPHLSPEDVAGIANFDPLLWNQEGWEGDTARALLEFVREDLVRPLVIGLGMRGRVASQAESTGWAAAWRSLSSPSIADAPAPWGVVWSAVDRAVRGEMLATRYATSVRKAWDIHRELGALGMFEAVSYEQLELDLEPAPPGDDLDEGIPVVAPIREALLGVGWDEETLDGLLADILTDTAIHPDGRRNVAGWRPLARRWGLEPWRARRLVVALMGDGTWPGLIGSVYEQGLGALETPAGPRGPPIDGEPQPPIACASSAAGRVRGGNGAARPPQCGRMTDTARPGCGRDPRLLDPAAHLPVERSRRWLCTASSQVAASTGRGGPPGRCPGSMRP